MAYAGFKHEMVCFARAVVDIIPPMGSENHTERISRMFASIAGRYDFLNRVLSLRRDVAWRRTAARALRFGRTDRFLDVATGTGDLAIDVMREHAGVSALGVDLVEELMVVGRQKIERMGLSGRMDFVLGNALELPVADSSFDAAGIAFGIRNIPDREAALRELARAVVPGGQVLVLELSAYAIGPLKPVQRLYLTSVLPRIARLFTPMPDAYEYLARSILEFPSPEEFSAVMRRAGLQRIECRALTLGAAYMYIGYKPR